MILKSIVYKVCSVIFPVILGFVLFLGVSWQKVEKLEYSFNNETLLVL